MKTFFTSDTHFGHNNIIKYTQRPFANSREMDEAMIARWNEAVDERDTIYHLGDFSLSDAKFVEHIFPRLNGRIKVLGNHWHHDKRWIPQGFGKTRFVSASEIPVEILPPIVVLSFKHIRNKGRPQVIVLCHYAMAKWDRGHHGSWHLYGHSHGAYSNGGLSMDVGVDCNDFRPFSLEEVTERMQDIASGKQATRTMAELCLKTRASGKEVSLSEARQTAIKAMDESDEAWKTVNEEAGRETTVIGGVEYEVTKNDLVHFTSFSEHLKNEKAKKQTDVHTEHCCKEHGCKYGDAECTVTTGKKPQSFECLETSVCYDQKPGYYDDMGK